MNTATATSGADPMAPQAKNTEMSGNRSDVSDKNLFASAPAALTACNQWLGWKWGERNGKPTKIPVEPTTGRNTDAPKASWSFEDAMRGVLAGRCDGIGISLRNGVVGIDYDHVLDADTGEFKTEYAHIASEVEAAGSYTEVSPSGEGLHVLVICSDIPTDWKEGVRRQESEMYTGGRYFTVTGEMWDHSPNIEIATVTAETLRPIYERIAGQGGGGEKKTVTAREKRGDPQIPSKHEIDTGELSFWAKFSLKCVKECVTDWKPGEHGIPGGADKASEAMQSVMTRAARDLARIGYPVYHQSYAAAIYEIFLATPVYEEYYAPGKGHDAHPEKLTKSLDKAMTAGREYYREHGGK